MSNRTTTAFVLILLLALVALYLVLPVQHPEWITNLLFWQPEASRSLEFQRGLDLQGGLQVLLAPDLPAGQVLPDGALQASQQIVENRVNALGLTEPLVQTRGSRNIIVELPGIADPEQAVDTIRGTALLEFIESSINLLPGTPVTTTYGLSAEEATAALALTTTQVYSTVMTGADLKDAYPTSDQQTGEWGVSFELQSTASDMFAQYTTNHLNRPLCIVLDKVVISCPTIRSAIPDGKGSISGNFTYEEANKLAIQLRYGALPVPLKIESYKAVGPTLGQTSVERSIRAGVIGLVIVFLFMIIYYRLNGVAAALALALYVLLNLLLYKLVPITMTLPGIAGFLLSAGMAVDANILVFERMKEELRRGRSLGNAAEAGFSRAWTSVRDSNLATLLTCVILFVFGNAFAASLVKGFAITLALGTVINLFTAIAVTRTFVRVAFGLIGDKALEHPWLLGI